MDDHAPRRGAALARGAQRAEHDGARGHIEVRGLIDDDGVVAAEFEQRLAQSRGHGLRDAAADGGRTGEGQQRHAAVGRQPLAVFAAMVEQQLKNRWRKLPFEHPIAQVLHSQRAQRCFRRGFPDAGIAADDRQQRVPGPDGDRKVERGDDADHSERVPLFVHTMQRALGMHRPAVEHARLTHRKIGDVDHFLHFTERLGQDLAVLERDHHRQLLLVRAQFLGNVAHELAACRRGYLRPVSCRLRRAHHGGFVAGGAADGNAREQAAIGGIESFECAGAWGCRLDAEMREQCGRGAVHDRIVRWRPGAPLRTTSPEMSLLPPAARCLPKRLPRMSGRRKDSCVTRP